MKKETIRKTTRSEETVRFELTREELCALLGVDEERDYDGRALRTVIDQVDIKPGIGDEYELAAYETVQITVSVVSEVIEE